MIFGSNSAPMTIRRRPVLPGNPGGVARGDPVDVFSLRCTWRQVQGTKIVEAGLAEDATNLIVRVRDSTTARTITAADRAVVKGIDYAITTVGVPDRAGGFIEMVLRRQAAGK